jgi:drug/metabolite transporter (DMT)-like permease
MKRAVRTLIQIIGVSAALFGLLEIGLEIAHHQVQVRNHVDPVKNNVWAYVIGAVLLFVGFILFAGSNSLAEQLTDDYDDDDDDDNSGDKIDAE